MAACKKVTLGKRNQSRKEVSVQTAKLIFWVLLCQLPAWAGMGAVSANMDWYHALLRPSFTPPDWMFGAAWSVLYLLLSAVGFLITKNGLNAQNRPTVLLFVVQLAANALWTPVFFGRHAMAAALLLLSVLIFLTAWLIKRSWRKNRPAAWLLAPYILWLLFAWNLNYAFLLLN